MQLKTIHTILLALALLGAQLLYAAHDHFHEVDFDDCAGCMFKAQSQHTATTLLGVNDDGWFIRPLKCSAVSKALNHWPRVIFPRAPPAFLP